MNININQFKAELITPPIIINKIFFALSSFAFHAVKLPEEKGKMPDMKISFDAKIISIDETNKRVQIHVTIQSLPEQEELVEFAVMCVGIYTWLGDALDEDAVKKIYQWGTSIQVSTIREHVIKETSRGPYSQPSYIPMGLIQIKNEHDTPTKVKSKKTSVGRGKSRNHRYRPEA